MPRKRLTIAGQPPGGLVTPFSKTRVGCVATSPVPESPKLDFHQCRYLQQRLHRLGQGQELHLSVPVAIVPAPLRAHDDGGLPAWLELARIPEGECVASSGGRYSSVKAVRRYEWVLALHDHRLGGRGGLSGLSVSRQ